MEKDSSYYAYRIIGFLIEMIVFLTINSIFGLNFIQALVIGVGIMMFLHYAFGFEPRTFWPKLGRKIFG